MTKALGKSRQKGSNGRGEREVSGSFPFDYAQGQDDSKNKQQNDSKNKQQNDSKNRATDGCSLH